MNYKGIVYFTYLVMKRRDVPKASQSCTHLCNVTKNMFVWKPVIILKLNLYLNVRIKSFTC